MWSVFPATCSVWLPWRWRLQAPLKHINKLQVTLVSCSKRLNLSAYYGHEKHSVNNVCTASCCTIDEKWHRFSHNWTGVKKNCVFNVSDISVWIYCLRKRMGLIIIVAHISYHTPVKVLYGLTRKTCSFKSSHTHRDETHFCCWTEWVCISSIYPMTVFVGPCHHVMVRPQVADGGTASNMESSCE